MSLNALWYERHWLRWLLWPFALIYQLITIVRRFYLVRFCQQDCDIPIVVVGNITVGGVGKTPLVIALAQQLQARGIRVGIVSRGYGAETTQFPHEVQLHESAKQVGDEPLLLAKRTGCPIVIAPSRMQAVRYLQAKYQPQVIISDDGLQHYKMGRAVEIAVIDGVRHLGNTLCLPAGPLRESKKRLEQVDFIVVNGGTWPNAYRLDLQPGSIIRIMDGKCFDVTALPASLAAVAAIGHPQRFFATLRQLGLVCKEYSFPDHHAFQPTELELPEQAIIMTEKDAVKCKTFATENMYFLPVETCIDETFWDAFWAHPGLSIYNN